MRSPAWSTRGARFVNRSKMNRANLKHLIQRGQFHYLGSGLLFVTRLIKGCWKWSLFMVSRPFCSSFTSSVCSAITSRQKKKTQKNQIQTTGTGPASPNMEKTPATQLVEKTKQKSPDCYQLGWLVLALPPLQRNKKINTVNTIYLWDAANRKWTLRLNTSCFSLFKNLKKWKKRQCMQV